DRVAPQRLGVEVRREHPHAPEDTAFGPVIPVRPVGIRAARPVSVRTTGSHPLRRDGSCERNPVPPGRGRGDEMNVLIVALDAATPPEVPDPAVLVVAPALNSWLRRWVSDEDDARRR